MTRIMQSFDHPVQYVSGLMQNPVKMRMKLAISKGLTNLCMIIEGQGPQEVSGSVWIPPVSVISQRSTPNSHPVEVPLRTYKRKYVVGSYNLRRSQYFPRTV